jgi:aminoglycoside 2'-N-acetyltransferase I
MTEIRQVTTGELRADEIASLRELLWAAFGDDEDEAFSEHDWTHALGGTHVLLEADGLILSHAAVVQRDLVVAGRHLRTGYVEAVATRVGHQRRGFGSSVMREVRDIIVEQFELGVLGTGVFAFYEPLGWEHWRGPTSVRTADGVRRTPDEDGYILVLRTAATADLDLDLPISCEWRPGDVW